MSDILQTALCKALEQMEIKGVPVKTLTYMVLTSLADEGYGLCKVNLFPKENVIPDWEGWER